MRVTTQFTQVSPLRFAFTLLLKCLLKDGIHSFDETNCWQFIGGKVSTSFNLNMSPSNQSVDVTRYALSSICLSDAVSNSISVLSSSLITSLSAGFPHLISGRVSDACKTWEPELFLRRAVFLTPSLPPYLPDTSIWYLVL